MKLTPDPVSGTVPDSARHYNVQASCNHTHRHIQPFYGPLGFCPGLPR